MPSEAIYLLAADTLLIVHTLFVLFVVFGVLAIYVGHYLSWDLIRNYWFRVLHLAAVAFVILEAWIGIICPLTIWEMQLREIAGGETYSGSFIQHWLQVILYYEAPAWVFTMLYSLFGILVFSSWLIIPPNKKK